MRDLDIAQHTPPPEWDDIFNMRYKTTRETKLQSFAYNLVYRLTPCNRQVPHGMHMVCNFWQGLVSWCDDYLDLSLLPLTEMEILLGVSRPISGGRVINWIILYAKFYIQKRKLFFEADISVLGFLAEVRSKLYIERQACLFGSDSSMPWARAPGIVAQTHRSLTLAPLVNS